MGGSQWEDSFLEGGGANWASLRQRVSCFDGSKIISGAAPGGAFVWWTPLGGGAALYLYMCPPHSEATWWFVVFIIYAESWISWTVTEARSWQTKSFFTAVWFTTTSTERALNHTAASRVRITEVNTHQSTITSRGRRRVSRFYYLVTFNLCANEKSTAYPSRIQQRLKGWLSAGGSPLIPSPNQTGSQSSWKLYQQQNEVRHQSRNRKFILWDTFKVSVHFSVLFLSLRKPNGSF